MEKKYVQSALLIDRIDWDAVMSMPRYAGGHDDQMKGLFKNVTVLGHYNEGDYQGQVATCVRFNDTQDIVIYTDYYGSCSGCDAWEGADDEDVKKLCTDLATGAYIFANLEDCIEFLKGAHRSRDVDFKWQHGDCARGLLAEILETALEEARKQLGGAQ